MNAQSNTHGGGTDPRWTMKHLERLAKEKCDLPGTSSVPEVKAQQIREINSEALRHINWFCIKRLDGDL